MTPRARRWIWWTGGAVVALALAALLVVAAAPWAVCWAATAWAESIIGRPVTAGEVRVSLRDARVVFHDVVVAGVGPDHSLAAIERIVVDLRWRPILRGRVRVEQLELAAPVVRIVRAPDGATSLDDVVEHLRREPSTDAPMDIEIARAAVHDGRVVFTDREVTPTRVWQLQDLTASFAHLATRGEPRGTGTLSARVADGRVAIDADQVRLSPFHLRAAGRATGLDVAGVAAYVPADAPLRPVAGQLSTQTQATVDAGVVRLRGRATLENLEVLRTGQDEPFMTFPRLTLTAVGVRLGHGPTVAERAEVDGSVRVHDTRTAGRGPVVLSPIHGVLRDVRVGAGAPATLRLDVGLPDDGTLTARGPVTFEPLSADLVASLTDAPLGLVAAYIPASSPVQVGSGRLAAELSVRFAAEQGARISGELSTSRLELYRRGAADPFLIHPRLDVTVGELRVHDGAVAAERLTVSGHPTFVDHSVTPAVRWEVAEATGTVSDFSWPSGPPARVRAAARLKTGGRSTLEGTVRPSPLHVTARVRVHDFPAARLGAYLPEVSAVRIAGGTVAADIRLEHAEDGPVDLAGTMTAADLAVRDGDGTPIVTDPSVRLEATAAVGRDGGVVIERATLDATPVVAGVDLRALHVEVGSLRWPSGAPARVRATARLPEAGSLEASGTVRPEGSDVALAVTVRDAALGPWRDLVDIDAPVAGRVDAELTVAGNVRSPETLTTSGQATARKIRVGEGDEPAIRVETLAARGLVVEGRERLHVDVLLVEAPAIVVTREEDGFPILAMLGLRDERGQDRRTQPSAHDTEKDTPRRRAVDIDRIAIENGYARFVDRTTSPPFTQELRRISAVVRDLDTTDAAPARIEVDAVVGDGGALHLAGHVAPFAWPFALDVAGTLEDFRVPATNPYLRRTFGWIANRGRLTTEVRYRVEGNRLEATNDVLVERLSVGRAQGEVDPRIGVPLGLIVALLKNARGDIEVSVPVSGDLGRPEFGFGDALARAARQLVGKVITGPFRAIGRALRGDDPGGIADLDIDPVRFPDGEAHLPDEAREHLRQVGDFLRETPGVGITLRPVVARDDLDALRHEAAVARVQRHGREQGIRDFDAAARTLAGAAPDDAIDTVLATLAAREPLPVDAAQRLATARAAATREALAATAADTPGQVQSGAAAIEREDPAGGRVEIELHPRTAAGGTEP